MYIRGTSVSRLSGLPQGRPQGLTRLAVCGLVPALCLVPGLVHCQVRRCPSRRRPSRARSRSLSAQALGQDRSLLKDLRSPRHSTTVEDMRRRLVLVVRAACLWKRGHLASTESRRPAADRSRGSCPAVPRSIFVANILVRNLDLLSGLRLGDLAGEESGGRPSTPPSDSSKHQKPVQVHRQVCSQRFWPTKVF